MVSFKELAREAYFAGVNLDANYYTVDVSDPDDVVHKYFDEWYENWWSKKFHEAIKIEMEGS